MNIVFRLIAVVFAMDIGFRRVARCVDVRINFCVASKLDVVVFANIEWHGFRHAAVCSQVNARSCILEILVDCKIGLGMLFSLILICNDTILRTFAEHVIRVDSVIVMSLCQVHVMRDCCYLAGIVCNNIFALFGTHVIANVIVFVSDFNRVTL